MAIPFDQPLAVMGGGGGGGVTEVDAGNGVQVSNPTGPTVGVALTDAAYLVVLNTTGVNSGDLTLSTNVGASPNSAAASLTGQMLTLQPADSSHPGVLSTGDQDISGVKRFLAGIDLDSQHITNLADPMGAQDAATKAYVDAQSGSGITELTGDVSAGPGSGSQTSTVNTVGGSTAANINSTVIKVAAATANPTINTLVERDASDNFAVNAVVQGEQVVSTAAGLTVLTVASPPRTIATGTLAQTFQLPDATTLRNGQSYDFWCRSTQTISITYNDTTSLKDVVSLTDVALILVDNSTTNGVWSISANYLTGTTGDVSGTGPGISSTSITSGAVTSAKMAINAAATNLSTSTSAINVNSQKIVSLLDPTDPQDATTKNYVDNKVNVPNVSQSAAGLVASAGQLLGTNTNDSASVGNVGEIIGPISRVFSNSLALSNGSVANICTTPSITLTAGDWDVQAMVSLVPTGSTSIVFLQAGISKTSATMPSSDTLSVPTSGEVSVSLNAPATVNSVPFYLPIPSYRVTVANGDTMTLYLVAYCSFSVSTLNALGSMFARRAR